jgi:hypothetical protein
MTARTALPPRSTAEPPEGSFGVDQRGARFEGASLRGANFAGIRTGPRPADQAILVALALAVSIALGVITGWSARYLMALITGDDPRRAALALQAFAGVLVFLAAGLWKGGDLAVRVVLPVIAALFVAAGLIAIATGVGTGVGVAAVFAFLLLAVVVIGLGSLVRAVAGTVTTWTFVLVAVTGGLAGGAVGGGVPAIIVAVSAALIGRRSLHRSTRYPALARACVKIACARGTRFRGADLTGARFTGARLVACDFRGARLAGADFRDATFTSCLFDGGRDRPSPAQLEPDAGELAPTLH